MVLKKSEYQQQYRSSVVKKHQETYLENLQLRHQRRDREFLHTPICWGSPSEGDDEPSSSDSNEESCVPKKIVESEPVPQYQSLAEILADAKGKSDAHRLKRQSDGKESYEVPDVSQLQLVNSANVNNSACTAPEKICDNNVTSTEKDIGDKSFSLYDMLEEENRKLHEKLAKQYTSQNAPSDLSKAVGGDDIEKDSFPEKDIPSNLRENALSKRQKEQFHKNKKYHFKQTRPKSSTKEPVMRGKYRSTCQSASSSQGSTRLQRSSGRLLRPDRRAEIPKAVPRPDSTESLSTRPPFFAYGAGDVEDSLSAHRTHNVLALTDVYMPALKAKTRREEERRQQRKRREKAKHAEALLLSRLSAAAAMSPRDQADWRSEYQKQFHAYEPRDYERAVSARAVIPHSAPIRAVHRGGCLMVHVD